MKFWESIDKALDDIATHKHETFDAVKATLDAYGNPDAVGIGTRTADKTFFGGSGGDRALLTSLTAAGWGLTFFNASYHYGMYHAASGDRLEYIEGDVIRGQSLAI